VAKPDLRDNRKFLKLRRLLGEPTPHVIGYLECLWNRGYQTGNPVLGDELDVEAAAEYPNEPKKFAQAAHLAGFLDQDENGRYVIHQLYEHAPKYAKARMTRLGFAPKPSLITDPKKDASKAKTSRKRPKKDESKPVPANVGNKTENQEPRTKNQEPRTENQKPEENQIPSAAAAAVAATEPNPPTVSPEIPTRPRDELFDAIASAAAVDPKTAGGLVAKVAKALRGADPPYTPDDVRQFAAEYGTHCPWGPRDGRDRPTPNEIQTHIGKIRAAPAPSAAAMIPHAKPPPKQMSFAAAAMARNDAILAAATGKTPELQPRETTPLAIENAK
jgi:hypothetical protein